MQSLGGDFFRARVLARGAVGISALGWLAAVAVDAQVAFNDYAPGLLTHSNASTIGMGQAGPLRDIKTGAGLPWQLHLDGAGFADGAVQGNPVYGTPASVVFDGFVDFFGAPSPGIELTGTTNIVTYIFTGLDPAAEYNFQGTAIRGHFNYKDRWSLFEITGAAAFSSRHTAGALTSARVPALTSAQVAINTGDNNSGDLAWWEHIRTGPDGTFAVTSHQYSGAVPGGTSAGPKGYGLISVRLEQAAVYSGRVSLPPRIPNTEPNAINGVRTVFIIMMENHDWSTIAGSSFCPYINNTLLPRASYATHYHSPPSVHPSEPNYLWLVAATNFNVRNDDPPSLNHQSSTNTLFAQLDRAGLSWKTYQENITGTVVPDANSGPYAVRHNPFVFFDSVRDHLKYCTNHVRPYLELAGDLISGTVPRFVFISPNVTNDMHDSSPGSPSTRKQGDDWLAREVPKILASPAYTNNGALFITWDEGSNESDGAIGMILLSPRAKGGGYHTDTFYTHSSWVRTVQDIFGLRPYLAEAAYVPSLSGLFKTIQLTVADRDATGLRLRVVNLVPGRTNHLEAASDPVAGPWRPLQTNVATSASMLLTVPAGEGLEARFYRIVEPAPDP